MSSHGETNTEDKPGSGRTLLLIAVASVIVLWLPAPEGMTAAAHRLMAVTVLMAGLWVTQAIPLAATSLIPLGLFPLLGIMRADSVSKAFVNDTLFLYLGGMIIAMGIERWQLHRRIALNVVNLIGVSPKRLVMGFLIATAGLSMWISNTACTLLMLPIALALLKTLDDSSELSAEAEPSAIQNTDAGSIPDCHSKNQPEYILKGRKSLLSDSLSAPLLLGIAYAASLGGMTTLVGTPTNQAALGIYRDELPNAAEITVAQWLIVCGPIGAVYLAVTWFVLTRGLPGPGLNDIQLHAVLKRRLQMLGKKTPAENRMLVVFALTGFLWICRKPLVVGDMTLLPGWLGWYTLAFEWLGANFGSEVKFPAGDFVSDSTVAVVIAIFLFVLPSGTRDSKGRALRLMDWPTANRLPWDMILLFGGGFALADAFRETGLSAWLGDALQGPLKSMPPWFVVAALCTMMTFLTEFTSNVATVSTVMPTLLAIASALQIDARVVFIPAALAASCAFMMPVGTPPNAIVFGTGLVTIRQMAGYGLVLNLIGIPILTIGAFFIIEPVLGKSEKQAVGENPGKSEPAQVSSQLQ